MYTSLLFSTLMRIRGSLHRTTFVSARQTKFFVPLPRDFDREGPLDDVYALNAQIFAEVRAIVELQTPEELPLGLASEAHFSADKSSTTYRHLLSGMRSGRRFTT